MMSNINVNFEESDIKAFDRFCKRNVRLKFKKTVNSLSTGKVAIKLLKIKSNLEN